MAIDQSHCPSPTSALRPCSLSPNSCITVVLCHLPHRAIDTRFKEIITTAPSIGTANISMHKLLPQSSSNPVNMASPCPDQHVTTCCSTDTTLPLPVYFSEDSIKRQLSCLPTPRFPSLNLLCQPVHPALMPALLYVPAYYTTISTPCVNGIVNSGHKRVDSAVVVDDDSKTHSKDALKSQTAPWFESATAQVLDREKERTRVYSRGRDEWDCDFCGLECFCEDFSA